MRLSPVRDLWAGFAIDPASTPRPQPGAMVRAAALGVGLSALVLLAGWAICFPFDLGLLPTLLAAIVPLLTAGLLTLIGLGLQGLARRGGSERLPARIAAAFYSASPVVLLQAVLAVAFVAPFGRLETREPELVWGVLALVLSLTWGAALLHSAWLAWLDLPPRLSQSIAGLLAFVAQLVALGGWTLLTSDDLRFDSSIFF
jgi:hypothetical protein